MKTACLILVSILILFANGMNNQNQENLFLNEDRFKIMLNNNNNHGDLNISPQNIIKTIGLSITLSYQSVVKNIEVLRIPLVFVQWVIKIEGYNTIEERKTLDDTGAIEMRIPLEKVQDPNTNRPGIRKSTFSNRKEGEKYVEATLSFFVEGEYVKVMASDDPNINGEYERDAYLKAAERVKFSITIETSFRDDDPVLELPFIFKGKREPGNNRMNNFLIPYILMTNAAVKLGTIGMTKKIEQVAVIIEIRHCSSNKIPQFPSHYIKNYEIICLSSVTSWEPLTILHEYGHHVMDQVFRYRGLTMHGRRSGRHKNCDFKPQEKPLAWSEGYATGFSVIMQDYLKIIDKRDLSNRIYPFDSWKNGEKIGYDNFEYYSCDSNDIFTDEGRIAAMLYDLYDEHNDSINDKEIETIFNKKNKNYFGSSLYSDANVGKTLTARFILIDVLYEAKETTLFVYLKKLIELTNKEGPNTCEILRYNYFNIDTDCETWRKSN